VAAIEVSCSQCGAGEYQLVDSRTGEVVCHYCRNQWIVPELAQKSETEKFLEEQAKQPRIIQDNSTETDRRLIGMLGSMASGTLLAGLRRIGRTILITVILIVALIVGLIVYRLVA
jgi:uncharacterized Zn finger protein (UPF0148 family)